MSALLVLTLTWLCCVHGQTSRFVKNLHMENRKVEDATYDVAMTVSLKGCARLCHDEKPCLSFTHNPAGGRCQMLPMVNINALENMTESGNRYFVKVRECPGDLGFVFDASVNLCYRLSDASDVVDYDTADSKCSVDGARLIVLDTSQKHNHVVNYLTSLGSAIYESGVSFYRVYVGMRKTTGGLEGLYLWSTGDDYVTLWEPGEPKWHLSENCVQILATGLSDIICTDQRPYMCEIPMY